MGRLLIGKERIELADFVRVCNGSDDVTLDETVLSRLIELNTASTKNPPDIELYIASNTKPTSTLSSIDARAFITGHLIHIMASATHTCISASVPVYLKELLNSRIDIAIDSSSPSAALISLADSVTQQNTTLSHTPLNMTKADYAALCTANLLGIASLSAGVTAVLANTADIVAALSCETVCVSIENFSASTVTQLTPLIVAAHLRTALQDSTQINVKRSENVFSVHSSIPVLHGAAIVNLNSACRSVVTALNAPHTTHNELLTCAVHTLTLCCARLRSASNARIDSNHTRTMPLTLKLFDDECADTSAWLAVLNLRQCIDELHETLSKECTETITLLKQKENEARNNFERSESQRKKKMHDALLSMKQRDPNASTKTLAKFDFKERTFKLSLGHGTTLLYAFVVKHASKNEAPTINETTNALNCMRKHSELTAMLKQALTASNEEIRRPKRAKGTRDFGPPEMMVRERVFTIIKNVFQRHGAGEIDTPVFELKETLTGKYGEDSKLIYDLADQGGEQLSLRYDLTVPFARYLCAHNITNMKRYHIARVYRRDNPAMARGRFREFYQCDFDIAGEYESMHADAEVLSVLVEVLEELNLKFKVKLNHRKLLDGVMAVSGVPPHQFRTICSAIDKLDKEEWITVREEMLEKGLESSVADCIGGFVSMQNIDPWALLKELGAIQALSLHEDAKIALAELEVLFGFLDAMNVLDSISFDMSLARGLDYYTGVIYEAVLTQTNQVGSIAAGGRYDNLVGMFSAKRVPAIGVSIGIERVLSIIEQRDKENNEGNVKQTRVQVLVASVGGDLTRERMCVCSELWRAGIVAEFVLKRAPKMQRQIEYALQHNIPFMIVIGHTEVAQGVVNVKNLHLQTQDTVKRCDVVNVLRNSIAKL